MEKDKDFLVWCLQLHHEDFFLLLSFYLIDSSPTTPISYLILNCFLVVAVFLSLMFAPLVFLGNSNLAIVGMILWGIGMGAQESILKAAVAGMVPMDKRASAYGTFSAGYGLAWFLGSALMGILYDQSVSLLVVFSVVIQFAAIPIFWLVGKHSRLSKPISISRNFIDADFKRRPLAKWRIYADFGATSKPFQPIANWWNIANYMPVGDDVRTVDNQH